MLLLDMLVFCLFVNFVLLLHLHVICLKYIVSHALASNKGISPYYVGLR